jgi:hypothetical protein
MSLITKMMGEGIYTGRRIHRQQFDHISLLVFIQNKKSRPKKKTGRWIMFKMSVFAHEMTVNITEQNI